MAIEEPLYTLRVIKFNMKIANRQILESRRVDWRGCLMLEMPVKLARQVHSWSTKNITEDSLVDDGRETFCHVTILYGFPQSISSSEIEEAIADVADIKVTLGKIIRFPASEFRPNSDVLVVEVESTQLREINQRLRQQFNVTSDYDTFNPHMTLAYVRPGAHRNLDNDLVFNDTVIISSDISYSSGPSDTRYITPISFKRFRQRYSDGIDIVNPITGEKNHF